MVTALPATRVTFRIAALCLVSIGLALEAGANPPIANPSFEIVGPAGSPTVHSPPAPGGAGQSAAESWGVFHNTAPGATTVTQLVASTLPAGPRMICVDTDGLNNGISQVTGPPGSGVQKGIASAWVFLDSGKVGMGSGNHGSTAIDLESTTTGTWEFLQAPNGVSPFNTMIFYDRSSGAEFCVEEASLLELQDWTSQVPLEYSNLFDEQAIAGGGGHGGSDAGQVLYTEPIDTLLDSNPRDVHDFFPGIENFEPDAQVDALANGGDGGFQELVQDAASLLVSLAGDPSGAVPVAVFEEAPSGFLGLHYTQRDLNALDPLGPEIEDVDALEMWGDTGSADDPADSNYYSLEFDFGASVWYDDGSGPVVYLTPGDIVGAVNQLGFDGQPGDADVDALMVQDTGVGPGVWDEGDAVLFSIRPLNTWDGGEIVYWEFGTPAKFLAHGGHLWDTAFDVTTAFDVPAGHENVDALETVLVPEPGVLAAFASGAALLGTLDRRRRRKQS